MSSFDVTAVDSAYATEFTVPQRVTVPSGGQRITLSLGPQDVRAELLTRTTPAREEAAYLVALLPTLPGVWPTATVALYRDGAFVGQGTLNNNDSALSRTGLSFGRDEKVIVTAEAVQDNTAKAGLTGSSIERTRSQAFRIENRHPRPVALQVLDAAPISQNEQVKVESRYDPAPTDTAWNRQPGAVLWSQSLPAGTSTRFTATHSLRYPQDTRLQERR